MLEDSKFKNYLGYRVSSKPTGKPGNSLSQRQKFFFFFLKKKDEAQGQECLPGMLKAPIFHPQYHTPKRVVSMEMSTALS
jgi:hypothetical protein